MSKPWKMTQLWQGQPCVIFGGGKSLTPEIVEIVRTSTHRVIVINNAWELAPWADMLYAADKDWWIVNKGAPTFQGLKVTCETNSFGDVLELKAGAATGFDSDPGVICTGGNSGYQAVCVAVNMGCPQILLCGFDMKPGHWHGAHKSPLRTTAAETYKTWIERFRSLTKPLSDLGVEVLNCSPGSALDAFPRAEIQYALYPEKVKAA